MIKIITIIDKLNFDNVTKWKKDRWKLNQTKCLNIENLFSFIIHNRCNHIRIKKSRANFSALVKTDNF